MRYVAYFSMPPLFRRHIFLAMPLCYALLPHTRRCRRDMIAATLRYAAAFIMLTMHVTYMTIYAPLLDILMSYADMFALMHCCLRHDTCCERLCCRIAILI